MLNITVILFINQLYIYYLTNKTFNNLILLDLVTLIMHTQLLSDYFINLEIQINFL